IVATAADAMEAGDTHYVASPGIIELRRAIVDKLRTENGLDYTPDEIIVTPGGKPAVYASLMALVDREDEVLVLEPGWVSYAPEVVLAEGQPVMVPMPTDENFRVTAELLRAYITPRTKALIFCSPNNPTGRVATDDELHAIASVAQEHNLIVLSDEIYEKLVYDGRTHRSLATLPGMHERTITLNGFSKAYAMTGWRLGYLAAPAPIVKQILKVHSHSVTCATSFGQRGAVTALTGPQHFIGEMVAAYDRRRHLVTDGLNAIPGVRCALPEGAFYAFPDITGTGLSSADCAELLIDQAGVAVTPGSAFGPNGEGFLRLAYSTSDDLLQRAVERMGNVLAGRVAATR
ncbi:MAG: pyridoxal phosphate-dependent aminotransferase, partial [Thermomicrobiales bacterium]